MSERKTLFNCPTVLFASYFVPAHLDLSIRSQSSSTPKAHGVCSMWNHSWDRKKNEPFGTTWCSRTIIIWNTCDMKSEKEIEFTFTEREARTEIISWRIVPNGKRVSGGKVLIGFFLNEFKTKQTFVLPFNSWFNNKEEIIQFQTWNTQHESKSLETFVWRTLNFGVWIWKRDRLSNVQIIFLCELIHLIRTCLINYFLVEVNERWIFFCKRITTSSFK